MAKLMRAAINGHQAKAHKAKVANMGACIASKLKDAKHMPATKCPCTLAKLANASQAATSQAKPKPVSHTQTHSHSQSHSHHQSHNELDEPTGPSITRERENNKKMEAVKGML